MELDPQRGEASRQTRLPQSFTLSKALRTTSMVPTRSTDDIVELEARASSSGAETTTSATPSSLLEATTTVMRASLFSAADMTRLGVRPTSVFRLAATLCESGEVVASSTEVVGCGAVDQSENSRIRTATSGPWQTTAARLDELSTRPAIERARLTPGVVMLDNTSGVFCMIGPSGKIYRPQRVFLDFGAQPLMLGKAACVGMGIRWRDVERCPFQIQTSFGGSQGVAMYMTCQELNS